MSVDGTIRVGDQILCDGGETKAVVRAILINPSEGTFDRVVIEPAHRVAVGQFAPAEKLSLSDQGLVFDGYLAFFDMNTRAETPVWSNPQSRSVGTITGHVTPVEGLMILEGTTEVLDPQDHKVGTLVGITVRAGSIIDDFVIRLPGHLRHKDVLVERDHEVAELGESVRLNVASDDLRGRPRT